MVCTNTSRRSDNLSVNRKVLWETIVKYLLGSRALHRPVLVSVAIEMNLSSGTGGFHNPYTLSKLIRTINRARLYH